MATIVITTNMSLDGVIEDPDGKEGASITPTPLRLLESRPLGNGLALVRYEIGAATSAA
jgi:hypothetical protein